MADKCYIYLLGLIIICPLLTGTSGQIDTHVFCSDGKNVILPCRNGLSDCTLTKWTYNRNRYSFGVLLFKEEIKNKDQNERLFLGSDCSLKIFNVTKEDYGAYICQEYMSRKDLYLEKLKNYAYVYLHFLHVSPSSTQTEIRPGSSVTLSCRLYSYDQCPFDKDFHIKGFQLVWVDQTGVNLQTDPRYQISSSSNCISTMTTTLLNEDKDREWRCQIIKGTKVTASASYTVKYLVSPSSTQTEIRPGSSVTLSCRLYSYDQCPFDEFLHTEGFQLVWVDQTGVNLQTDPRYQISSSSNCISTMTTTLLNEDKDREWRCQIIKGTEVKASASYTVKYLGGRILDGFILRVILTIIKIAAVITPTVILIWIICQRRAVSDKKRAQENTKK